MPPEHARSFAGGATETTISPVVLVALVVAVILILALPRKYVIVPLSIVLFLIPTGEQLVLGGFHLFAYRIAVLAGVAKMLVAGVSSPKGSVLPGGLNSVDKAFLWCTLFEAGAVVLLFLNADALVNQVGFMLDYLGGYFLLRFLVQDQEDIFRVIKCFAAVSFVVGLCMLRERFTLQNVFGLIGGAVTPAIRDGRVRAQGPFAHELMAGAFGSTVLALFVLLWKNGKAKVMAGVGMVGAGLMTWTSNSSTSLLSSSAGILAIALWPVRKSMRKVRWGIVIGLIALQLVMKAPVWFVIAHIDLTGGSSSYHRAELIDQFIRHFGDWWLMGVKDTGSWGWDMWDAQNQFVNVGETGGLVPFILFIAMISYCFSKLGKTRMTIDNDSKQEWLLWLLGAALFSNIVSFFGVNYFDQTKFAWFALLAMISAATVPLFRVQPATERSGVELGDSRLAYASLRTQFTSAASRRGPTQGRPRLVQDRDYAKFRD